MPKIKKNMCIIYLQIIRRPYLDIFKWFSWEIMKDVLKITSYARPKENVLCTSQRRRFQVPHFFPH